MTTKQLTPAVAYIRMSGKQQEASPDQQRPPRGFPARPGLALLTGSGPRGFDSPRIVT
jgi:hypothetical protein